MRKRPVDWVPLGSVGDFPPDETRLVTFDNPIRQPWDGMAAHIGVYVRRQGEESDEKDQFLVLAANCAHLGCPVSWFPQSGLFMCPCHGGVYYATGERPRGRRHAGFFTASGGCATGSWRFRLRIIRPCRTRWKNRHSGRPSGRLLEGRLRGGYRWDAG